MPPFHPRYLSSVAHERSQAATHARGRTPWADPPEVSLTAIVRPPPKLPGMARGSGAGGALASLIGCCQPSRHWDRIPVARPAVRGSAGKLAGCQPRAVEWGTAGMRCA